eukprot:TRINITY_DN23961_c0_g1_i1.p1 TRINITY_DN23961_c0_g1~~TRINITY_DN23961_c0_g1_i1.p1  ORF type:complete len:369 (+),score=56.08 TRINITY_DN23961_c0_g1_i1:204-1310(+)
MRLLAVETQTPCDRGDGLWVERPGYPCFNASWVHPPRAGSSVPEFEFDDGHLDVRNEPGPVFYIGTGNDCHVRLEGTLPGKACRLSKEGQAWFLEALLPGGSVHHFGAALEVGKRVRLAHGDEFSLLPLPTRFAFRIELGTPIDSNEPGYTPNKFPAKFSTRSSLAFGPPAPDELRRLAWQTDQMRRRSEEDLVKVSDWSAFSQYVKAAYAKHGITCVDWIGYGRQQPIDPKPPNLLPRALPSWIGELLATEQQVPGVDANRELPFASCLGLSETAASAENVKTACELYPQLRQSLEAWLRDLDESGHLQQYHDRLAARFASLRQLYDFYCKEGHLDPAFFENHGIRKLGHRRMFERWFRELGVSVKV